MLPKVIGQLFDPKFRPPDAAQKHSTRMQFEYLARNSLVVEVLGECARREDSRRRKNLAD
jgi:hypothetical protein